MYPPLALLGMALPILNAGLWESLVKFCLLHVYDPIVSFVLSLIFVAGFWVGSIVVLYLLLCSSLSPNVFGVFVPV